MTPARLRALADRYGQPGILHACLDDTGEAYRRTDFAGFLNLYKQVTLLLRSAADFHAVGLDLGAQLAADGVLYAEVTVSYGVLQRRGLDPLPIQRALHEAAAQIEAEYGVTMRWIGDAVRQWGVDAAWRAFDAAAHAGRTLGIVGFGLGGDETAAAPEPFAPLFADVATEGLGVTIHAGEVAGPESVRGAVEACGARRIGHGLSAAGDPLVTALLVARAVCVELCPGSNVGTGVVATDQDHSLRAFLAAEIPCCLNTDDRAIFGINLRGEYRRAAAVHELTAAEAVGMNRAALAAVFDAEAAATVGDAIAAFGDDAGGSD